VSDATDNPAGEPSDDRPQTAEELRAEIERTQAELGDTVEALAHKTDVKAQASARIDSAKETISQSVHTARETVQHTADDVVGKVRQATPESAGAGAHQVSAAVQEKPLPFATAGAFAAGLVVGFLLGRR
jgi:ElaB/YqjD/DUF883 family membrane-anchored ribosome-binding protein